jgi:hypothetical protein
MIALQPLNTGDITNKIKMNKKHLKISVNAPECTDQPIQPVLKQKAQVRRKKKPLPLIVIIFQILVLNTEIFKLQI